MLGEYVQRLLRSWMFWALLTSIPIFTNSVVAARALVLPMWVVVLYHLPIFLGYRMGKMLALRLHWRRIVPIRVEIERLLQPLDSYVAYQNGNLTISLYRPESHSLFKHEPTVVMIHQNSEIPDDSFGQQMIIVYLLYYGAYATQVSVHRFGDMRDEEEESVFSSTSELVNVIPAQAIFLRDALLRPVRIE